MEQVPFLLLSIVESKMDGVAALGRSLGYGGMSGGSCPAVMVTRKQFGDPLARGFPDLTGSPTRWITCGDTLRLTVPDKGEQILK